MINNPLANNWFLTGQTASGKSAVAVRLAEAIDAEIVSMDSMAVYQGMDIGTAKPTAEQCSQRPHHLLDILTPDREFSLAQYLVAAEQVAAGIRERGRQVLFVGGTPLYLKALLRGVFDGPPADWEFRRQVQAEAEAVGIESLHVRLRQVDPLAASKLHPHDTRRIIRALEVYKLSGQRISHLQMQFDEATPAEQRRVFVLEWPKEQLHARIEQRVADMLAAGLVREVRSLLTKYCHLSNTARQGVGYREVLEMLSGEHPEETLLHRVTTRTRRFAKRQATWFRGLEECQTIPRADDQSIDELVEEIVHRGEFT